jgi:hypothetical protein
LGVLTNWAGILAYTRAQTDALIAGGGGGPTNGLTAAQVAAQIARSNLLAQTAGLSTNQTLVNPTNVGTTTFSQFAWIPPTGISFRPAGGGSQQGAIDDSGNFTWANIQDNGLSANSLVGSDGSKFLKSLTVGTGLSFDGTTLDTAVNLTAQSFFGRSYLLEPTSYVGIGQWNFVVDSGDGQSLRVVNLDGSGDGGGGYMSVSAGGGVFASGGFAGDGSGLTALAAGNILSGTMGDARLSANVALLNRNPQTFTGSNIFSGGASASALTASAANFSNSVFLTPPVGDGSGWTNLLASHLFPNGITTNVAVVVPGPLTNTLQFSSGILTNVAFGVCVPPSISIQPVSVACLTNSTTNFTVTATGTATLAYQWLTNGVPVASDLVSYFGATTATLTISNVTAAAPTNFSVVITNSCGSITSSVATKTVTNGVGGGFGGSALLDDFNRANGNLGGTTASGGGTWTFVFGSDMLINGNLIQPNGNSLDYLSSTFSADVEVFMTIVNVGVSPNGSDNRGLMVRYNSGTGQCYFLYIDADANWHITLDVGGSSLGTATQAIAAGDAMGLSAIGSTIKAWYKPSGGSWTALITVTDSTYSGSGKIAVQAAGSTYGTQSDDLHGGNR